MVLLSCSMASAELTGACLSDGKAQCPGVQPGGSAQGCNRVEARVALWRCWSALFFLCSAPKAVKEFQPHWRTATFSLLMLVVLMAVYVSLEALKPEIVTQLIRPPW
jgi:hypothetical protein